MRRIGIRLSALAQDGLTYAADEYDRDRYRQLSLLAAELLSVLSGRPAAELAVELGRDSGYATPKVDVRGVIFDASERVLLMRERADGRWSLPGGWADPGEAPSAAVTREILEETGYRSSAVKLIACWDRELQDNPPPLPVHVYKLFFLCRRDGGVQPPAAARQTTTMEHRCRPSSINVDIVPERTRAGRNPCASRATATTAAAATARKAARLTPAVTAVTGDARARRREPRGLSSGGTMVHQNLPGARILPGKRGTPRIGGRCGWCQNTEG